MRFKILKLDDRLLKAIEEIGYERCTPVQEQSLPESLAGNDLISQSQTGTGKTAVFLITVIQRLIASGDEGGRTRAIILVPTRELAVQVEQQAVQLCKHLPYRSIAVFGGVGYDEQEKKLREGVEIVVATTGRLIDYLKSGKLRMDDVTFMIMDEADRMFDMGFMPDVRYILYKAPPKDKRQTMIFSATLDFRVRRLAEQFMREPVEVEIEPDQITVDKVKQKLFHVSREEKLPLLLSLFQKEEMPKVIIFTNMKRTAERLGYKLKGNGIAAGVITGDVDQKKRLRVMEQLQSGHAPILVATDVAARGIHIDNVTHIINYDVPADPAAYVHRIGRTARAGAEGTAYTIACEDYVEHLPEIEDYIDQKISVEHIDFELEKDKAGVYRKPSMQSAGHRPVAGGPRSAPRSPRRKAELRPAGGSSAGAPHRRSSAPPHRTGRRMPESPDRKMTMEERLAYYGRKYGETFKPVETSDNGLK